MNFDIVRQESYSRGELLLRTFFGWLYISLPHVFLMIFFGIWAGIAHFISWWTILFTGRYPESFFEFQSKLIAWQLRLNASMGNLIDGYPSLGISGSHPAVTVSIPRQESYSRGLLLLRTFFGVLYVGIPHVFCLYFRSLATGFLQFLSWWAILFTGEIPQSWFEFNVGTMRWGLRYQLYMANMTDSYPPFSGKPDLA